MAPRRLGEILEKCLRRSGLQQRIREQKLLDAWDGIVGKAIAESTQPVRVRNRVLQVKVINSMWMHELQFHKKLIIEKLNEYSRDSIQDLRFFIGEKGEVKKPAPAAGPGGKKPPELTPEEKARIENEVVRLRDPEMREIMSRVFSRGLSAGKNRGKGGTGA